MSERIIFAALVVLELSGWLIMLGLGWGAHPILLVPWLAFGAFFGGLLYESWRLTR